MSRDLSGQRFGFLTVLGDSGERSSKYILWDCQCDCGGTRKARSTQLHEGVVSCGCGLGRRLWRQWDGDSKNRLYGIWIGMKVRCQSPKHIMYHVYGSRGIAVCDEWRDDFHAFQSWALSNGYTDDLSIDRVDNDKGYCPDNCRWVTTAEQARNKRSNRWLTIHGEEMLLVDAARKYGVHKETIRQRLKRGWTPERAVEPV